MIYKAAFRIELSNPILVYRSIRAELDRSIGDGSKRASVKLGLCPGGLYIYIRADGIVMLRATLNTWLRLIKIADDMVELSA